MTMYGGFLAIYSSAQDMEPDGGYDEGHHGPGESGGQLDSGIKECDSENAA